MADFERIKRGEAGEDVFSDPIAPASKTPQSNGLQMGEGFEGPQLEDQVREEDKISTVDVPRKKNAPQQRALMAKDVVKTIMAVAGFEDKFNDYYDNDFYQDAQVLTPLVKK